MGLVTVTTAWLKPRVQSTVWTGADGTCNGAVTVIDADAGEVHPAALVTVKVYVPCGMPVAVNVVPEPVTSTAPGLRVRVQLPVEGNPLIPTLPVVTAQVG